MNRECCGCDSTDDVVELIGGHSLCAECRSCVLTVVMLALSPPHCDEKPQTVAPTQREMRAALEPTKTYPFSPN